MDALLPIVVAIGMAPVLWWLSELRFAHNPLFRAPVVKIADATRGKPTLAIGRVRSIGQPLVAPLSRRPCVAYELLLVDSALGRSRQLARESEAQDFIVEDDSGRALVVVERASLALNVAWLPFRMYGDMSHHVALLRRHGFGPSRAQHFTFIEMVLVPGERVAVFGPSEHRPDPTREPRDYRSSSNWLAIRAFRLSNDESVLCRG
jgi:hypothetical protein